MHDYTYRKGVIVESHNLSYGHCKALASACGTLTAFKKKSHAAYTLSKNSGWLAEFFPKKQFQRPNGYWTYERCKEEASKFTARKKFKIGCEGAAYITSCQKKWIDDFFPPNTSKPAGYWTIEKIKELIESECIKSKQELADRFSGAHNACSNNGWLDELFGKAEKMPDGTWTKEACQAEALKYNHRNAFRKACNGAYCKAKKMGWTDEICSHMLTTAGINKCVYLIVNDETKTIYIGITHCFEWRWSEKNTRNSVNRPDIVEFAKTAKYKQITDYMHRSKAGRIERKLIARYRREGWTVLNRSSGGESGPMLTRWNHEMVEKLAAECYCKTDMYKRSPGAYRYAKENGLIRKLFPGPRPSPRLYINKKPNPLQLSLPIFD